MSGQSPHTTRKYSARSLAAGAVICPACRHRLQVRDSQVCPSCGFTGQDTMRIFPFPAPPLEMISDHAQLFTARDEEAISKAIQAMRRGFPQLHWRVVTADLKDGDDAGLFAFWLLNVSPPGEHEDISLRAWTILVVIYADADVAVVPGYAAEVWLSGQDWSHLLRNLHDGLRKGNYGSAVRAFLARCSVLFRGSWQRARGRTSRKKRFLDGKL